MSSREYVPWIIKYRPRSLSDYVDQDEAKTFVVSWVKDWLKGVTPSKKAVLLHGPPGVGKTALVEALAGEFKLEVVEMNASDFRRKVDVERILAVASKARSFDGKPKLVLVDELDGLSGYADAGGVEALMTVIREARNPIIMTANNAYANHLRPIRTMPEVVLLELKELGVRDVLAVLKKICATEGVSCDDTGLRAIYNKNGGDLRSCINDLESLGRAYGRVTEELVNGLIPYRDRELDPFESLRGIFFAKQLWQAKGTASRSQLDFDTLMMWLDENIPVQLTDPESIYQAYEALSRADVYRGLIVKTGSWDLLSYAIDMATAGVNVAARREKLKWVKFGFPARIKLAAETKSTREKLNSAAAKIASYAHASTRTALKEYIPMLRTISKLNKELAAYLMKSMGINEEEALVITGDQAVVELMKKRLTQLAEAVTKKPSARKQEAGPRPTKERRTGYTPSGPERGSPSARSKQRSLF